MENDIGNKRKQNVFNILSKTADKFLYYLRESIFC